MAKTSNTHLPFTRTVMMRRVRVSFVLADHFQQICMEIMQDYGNEYENSLNTYSLNCIGLNSRIWRRAFNKQVMCVFVHKTKIFHGL